MSESAPQTCARPASPPVLSVTDCSNLAEDRHILKRTDFVGIRSLLPGQETEFGVCGWGVFADDCSNLFRPCDVSRSKKTAQLLSVIPESNLKRVRGTRESDRPVFCTLTFKSRQSLCVFNETGKLISFIYTHISHRHQFPTAPGWLVLRRQGVKKKKKKCQYSECKTLDNFYSPDRRPGGCLRSE